MVRISTCLLFLFASIIGYAQIDVEQVKLEPDAVFSTNEIIGIECVQADGETWIGYRRILPDVPRIPNNTLLAGGSVAEARMMALENNTELVEINYYRVLDPVGIVYAMGQVNYPGPVLIPLDREYRLSQVVSAAGGVAARGSDRVSLKRLVDGVQMQQTVLLSESTGDENSDPVVQDGDAIAVLEDCI